MILGELGHPGMDGGLGDLPGTGCVVPGSRDSGVDGRLGDLLAARVFLPGSLIGAV